MQGHPGELSSRKQCKSQGAPGARGAVTARTLRVAGVWGFGRVTHTPCEGSRGAGEDMGSGEASVHQEGVHVLLGSSWTHLRWCWGAHWVLLSHLVSFPPLACKASALGLCSGLPQTLCTPRSPPFSLCWVVSSSWETRWVQAAGSVGEDTFSHPAGGQSFWATTFLGRALVYDFYTGPGSFPLIS